MKLGSWSPNEKLPTLSSRINGIGGGTPLERMVFLDFPIIINSV